MKGTVEMEVTRPGLVCAVCDDYLQEDGKCFDTSHEGTVQAEDGMVVRVFVECEFESYVEAKTQGDPLDCYPAYGGELLEMTATVEGVPFGLTKEEQKKAEDWCFKNALDRVRGWAREY